MLRHQHPAVSGGLEAMPRDQLDLAVINCHSAVESDAHFDQRSAQFARHAVAIAAHLLDVAVPCHHPPFAIGGIEAHGG
jgi:hypothetical protein